jgi:hypothetical protein
MHILYSLLWCQEAYSIDIFNLLEKMLGLGIV